MTDPLSKLSLFATDREIAIAVVGKERALMYVKVVIPALERHGFPKIDPLHDGRPVPLVRKWYNIHMGVDKSYILQSLQDGKENPEGWRSARDKRNDRKPKLGLNTRCMNALRYIVEHPDVRTSAEIPGTTDFTMNELASRGAIKEGKRDSQGDRTWIVADLGLEEIARLNDWHGGKRRI
ncbi:hypothetical protein MUO32_22325 [Shinella sp. CPCC 101442]|uniref:hypothetical protein n=1 Tax=Shinella sp. CPCC 101442 TaxID=2932265 RepID=UPI002152D4F3|nr:hypothetical protein [Shinella sp. CPCC 101442]MCR6501779.1 hypothetical protein [Shinella sp. CPCC 101442]